MIINISSTGGDDGEEGFPGIRMTLRGRELFALLFAYRKFRGSSFYESRSVDVGYNICGALSSWCADGGRMTRIGGSLGRPLIPY